MSWALKGLVGPLQNKTIPLKVGLTLGRQGDIVINEIKASAIHAQIIQTPEGLWMLLDNKSKNGTRVDGERISSSELKLGMTLYIADQGFEVVEITDETVVPPQPPRRRERHWNEHLASFLDDYMGKFVDHQRSVLPLNPAVVLDFVRGPQVNLRWVLGYGPRKIGATSMDLPIWEPGAPALCFELLPSSDGIVFQTGHAELVRLNRQEVDSQVLRVGDTIHILETIIEVDFTE